MSVFALAAFSDRGSLSIVKLLAGLTVEQLRGPWLPGIDVQKSEVAGLGVGRPSPQWRRCIHSAAALWRHIPNPALHEAQYERITCPTTQRVWPWDLMVVDRTKTYNITRYSASFGFSPKGVE